jgi:hypothetical protein
VVVGGYCDYDDDRESVFLKNALQRFDAAIRDLKCEEFSKALYVKAFL